MPSQSPIRVLEAMRRGGVPVAGVHALCQDNEVIGSDFYIMDFVEGRVFWDPRLPDMSNETRAAIFSSMNSTIAQIHSLDPDAIGLADFGRKEDYLKRQIAHFDVGADTHTEKGVAIVFREHHRLIANCSI